MPTRHHSEDLQRRRQQSITKMSNSEALEHIGRLIDDSFDASFEPGASRAIHLLNELASRELVDTDGALVEYFRANAYALRSRISSARRSWSWELPDLQEELLALSRATNHAGFPKLDKIRRCQIFTNLANLLNTVGRTIDAIEAWDEALKIIPQFGMALGNRGCGLKVYAGMIEDDRERAILALHAFESLRSCLAAEAIYESAEPQLALAYFAEQAMGLEAAVDIDAVREMQKLEQGEEGESKAERAYRRWCVENRLFLCPLNELGPHLAAATDDLMLPPIMEGLDDRPNGHLPPPIIGFFNQLKQEYVSARFMLFEGISSTRVHFSDRAVALTDTLDYPLYSLASERVRTSFRIAYSLLDKVAFLVDLYWKLGKAANRVSFKNVWMVENKAHLLPQFETYDNLPLRGLFWLSKELFDAQLKETTSADARELHAIRNALEHSYLRVALGWAKPYAIPGSKSKTYCVEISSDELEAKAIRVMKIARSALLYVTLAIGIEERRRRLQNPDRRLGTMPLFGLDYRRKRRDPI